MEAATAAGSSIAPRTKRKRGLVSEVVEVLLAPGIGELVEHSHLVAVLAHALARERRADEPSAAADEQSHARIIPARAAR